jgi:hypothetical protein
MPEFARELRAPDLIEPVVGFRDWRIEDEELLSPYLPVAWDGGVLRAECLSRPGLFLRRRTRPPHRAPAPQPDCVCGIYAYFAPRQSDPDLGLVSGAVLLWGCIEVHRDGMRGRYARPVVLSFPRHLEGDKRGRRIGSVAKRLGLEVVPPPQLREAALRHGRPLPAALLPA